MEGAELEFTPEAPHARSPRKAKAKDTGARGLRSIVEDVMLDIMYELPERKAKEKGRFLVTPEVVRKEKNSLRHPSHAPDPLQGGIRAEERERLNSPTARRAAIGLRLRVDSGVAIDRLRSRGSRPAMRPFSEWPWILTHARASRTRPWSMRGLRRPGEGGRGRGMSGRSGGWRDFCI